jgi:hypothetical protein
LNNNYKKNKEMATKDRTALKNDFANGKYATGEKFADLIDSMKVVQLPVVDPQALGKSLSFIDSISQDEDGKITATKKTLDLSNAHELNPFKGWYKTGDTLPTDGFDGAYLYFKDTSEQTGLTTIYRWNGTTYAPTGTVVDTSNVQTFGSGQAVNTVKIKNENGEEVQGSAGVLSAEAGAAMKSQINDFELMKNSMVDSEVYTKSDFTVYQVNASSTVETSSGTRLRAVLHVDEGCTIEASNAVGSGVACALYDTLDKALCAAANAIEEISRDYVPSLSGTFTQGGYISISMKKADSTAISAEEKAALLAGLEVAVTGTFTIKDTAIPQLNDKADESDLQITKEAIDEFTKYRVYVDINDFTNSRFTPDQGENGNRIRIYKQITAEDIANGRNVFTLNCLWSYGIKASLFSSKIDALSYGNPLAMYIYGDYATGEHTITVEQAGWLCIITRKEGESGITNEEFDNILSQLSIKQVLSIKNRVEELEKPITMNRLDSNLQGLLTYGGIGDAVYTKSDFTIYQVNTSSAVETSSGTRLRAVLHVDEGCTIEASNAVGSGVACALYDTLDKAVEARQSNYVEAILPYDYAASLSGTFTQGGYITISMKKDDSTAISAEEKAALLAGLEVNVKVEGKGWIEGRMDEYEEQHVHNVDLALAAQKHLIIPGNNSSSPLNNLKQYLTLVHLTDIHGDEVRSRRAFGIGRYLGATMVCSGDLVRYNSTDDFDYLANIINNYDGKCVICVGNHDVWDFSADADSYTKYIAPFATERGWNVPTGGASYFYVDDEDMKVRYISVNQFMPPTGVSGRHYYGCWTQAQIDFIINAFTSIPSGYGVIVVMHSPETVQVANPTYGKFFQSPSFNYTLANIQPLRDIIDAFITKNSSFSKTWTNVHSGSTVETLVVSNVDFSQDASNEFICYITGHLHCDTITYVDGASNTQLILNETCTNAWVNKTTTGASGTSYPYFTELSDLARAEKGIIQDSFNVYVIDRGAKAVKVVRIGADMPKTLQARRDCMVIPYV